MNNADLNQGKISSAIDMSVLNGLNGINGVHVPKLVDSMAPEKDPEVASEESVMSVAMIHGKMNHVTGDMNVQNGLNGIDGAHVRQLVDFMAPEKEPEDVMEEAWVIVDITTGKISHATHSLVLIGAPGKIGAVVLLVVDME